MRIRTDSADTDALILLADGELVAVLVKLADHSHGDERGKWTIEATFGLRRIESISFASASDAADWVGKHVCDHPFELDEHLVELK